MSSEIEAAVIQSMGRASHEYIEAVVPGFVRDALRPDRRVTLVYNFVFAFTPEDKAKYFPELFDVLGDDGDAVFVHFDADTIYGTVQRDGQNKLSIKSQQARIGVDCKAVCPKGIKSQARQKAEQKKQYE